jgi:protein-L-isoaspartate O-methyltransferase
MMMVGKKKEERVLFISTGIGMLKAMIATLFAVTFLLLALQWFL